MIIFDKDTKFENMINNVVCGDCGEVMKIIPDNSINLIFTSPPYNQGLTTQDKAMSLYEDNLSESDYFKMIHDVFFNAKRILKDNASMYYNYKSNVNKNILDPAFKHLLKANELAQFYIVGEIVWNYAGDFDSTMTRWHVDYEMIYHLAKSKNFKFIYNKRQLSSIWNIKHVMGGTFEKKTCSSHPCPFPKHIVIKALEHSTNKDDIVVDPFGGSGTVALSCKELGRKFISIEIDKNYCEIQDRRLAQSQLF